MTLLLLLAGAVVDVTLLKRQLKIDLVCCELLEFN